jgi:hypothetical protein
MTVLDLLGGDIKKLPKDVQKILNTNIASDSKQSVTKIKNMHPIHALRVWGLDMKRK